MGHRDPARLIRGYADLASAIRERPARLGPVRLVAIDGPGGAGKSTFARRLSAALGGATIIETDDFASWDVPLEWWARLEQDVLVPIAQGRPVRYRRYDWNERRPGRWRRPTITETVLLEGVSSSRRAVADVLTLAIWIEAPRDLRLARGLERDGHGMRAEWDAWMSEEERHFAAEDSRRRATLRVDAAASPDHDPVLEFVAIDWPAPIARPATAGARLEP